MTQGVPLTTMLWGSPQVEEDPTGGKFAGANGLLNGARHKLEDVINFHVGDLVTALQRGALQPGGREVLLYATIMGAVGAPLLALAPLLPLLV